VVLTACSSDTTSEVELREQDSGSKQTLSVGQRLKIVLESNPSTGYQWALDGALLPQLEQAGKAVYVPDAGANYPGAGGVEEWDFVAKVPGEGNLKLKYWRSFEPTANPASTFEVFVDVQ